MHTAQAGQAGQASHARHCRQRGMACSAGSAESLWRADLFACFNMRDDVELGHQLGDLVGILLGGILELVVAASTRILNATSNTPFQQR